VDDDFTHRLVIQERLRSHGQTHVAINGREAVESVRAAMETGEPYDLVCLDIMMPEMNGQDALKEIRRIEESAGIAMGDGVKVIMITAFEDKKNVMTAFRAACDAYLAKPIRKDDLLGYLKMLNLVQ
jgi:two-component system chemotaxis response regulator CheY